MTKRREESDDRVVPEGGLTAAPPAAAAQDGKAVTVSKRSEQVALPFETTENPPGVTPRSDVDQPHRIEEVASKSKDTANEPPPAMTMEAVASEANVRRAFLQVAANRGAPGPDRQSVDEVRKHVETILPALSKALLDGSYKPGAIRRVWIPKSGGGERALGIPNVIDRIVQQAVHLVLGPNYEPTFHRSSHGFRPGRSCHTAIAEAVQYLEEGYEWVVDVDLERFFDRVHHQRLLARLEQRIGDRRLVRMIGQMLQAKVVLPDGLVVSTTEGTPQGGPLSPLLSNIVLDELDQELEERGHRFVRYADDCNIYVRSRRAGERVMANVTQFIERRLRLKVNAAKSAVALPEERHFVGFRLRRNPETGTAEVLLSTRSKIRIDEAIRTLTPRTWGRSVADCLQNINRYLIGWMNFFGICTNGVARMLATLDAHLRRRLRALILHQWKRKRFIVRKLVALGVRLRTARTIFSGRKSTWAISHSYAADRAMSPLYFEALGLKSLALLYEQQRVDRADSVGMS